MTLVSNILQERASENAPAVIARYGTALRIFGALVMVALLIGLSGCGSLKQSSVPINDQLFVPNYVPDLEGRLYHWSSLPLVVGFELPANWEQLYGADADLHIRAAQSWNQPDRQPMIRVAAPGEKATVPVEFVYQSELGGENLGLTEYTYDSTGLMRSASVRVALYTRQRFLMPAVDLQTVIAHEMGHALGIGGHSLSSADLMYASHVFGVPKSPTVRDLNTAMTAYPSYYAPRQPATRAIPPGPVTIYHDIIY